MEPKLVAPSSRYRGQIDAEIVAKSQEIVEAWASANNVVPYTARKCLLKLTNRNHRCNTTKCHAGHNAPGQFNVLDHAEMWKHKDTKGFTCTAHPYSLYELEHLQAWCEQNQVTLEVKEPANSWYIPGRTHLIVVRGK